MSLPCPTIIPWYLMSCSSYYPIWHWFWLWNSFIVQHKKWINGLICMNSLSLGTHFPEDTDIQWWKELLSNQLCCQLRWVTLLWRDCPIKYYFILFNLWLLWIRDQYLVLFLINLNIHWCVQEPRVVRLDALTVSPRFLFPTTITLDYASLENLVVFW